ncbi:MAG: hypothetical protein PQ614_06780 [Rickettsiales bacterium]|nr:hypothetical protein [Rickettsiales bacterium]
MKNLLSKLNLRIILLIITALLQAGIANARNEPIRVKDIKEISLDEIGVLDGNSGGLMKHIWHESNRSFMESLLVTMPVKAEPEIMKKLSKLLLLSTATPPHSDKNIVSSVFDIKIKKLALMGDYNNIYRMLSQVPDSRLTEEMHRIYVISFFIANQYIKGCDESENYLKKYPAVFWSKLRVVCNAYNDKQNNVDFDIKLLKEQGHELENEYQDVVDLFLKKQPDKAKEEWSKIAIKEALTFPSITTVFPNPQYLLRSPLDKQLVLKWLDKNKKETSDEAKLISAISVFADIDALGTQISIDIWRQFIMYALSKELQIPDYAAYRLLKQTPSDGERILTILHILDREDIKTIPQYLFAQMIYSLNKMGFKREAVWLAQQRLI